MRQQLNSMASGRRDGAFLEHASEQRADVSGGGRGNDRGSDARRGSTALLGAVTAGGDNRVHMETMKVLTRHTGEGWGSWSEEWRMAVLKVHLHDAADGWEARRQHRRASNALKSWEEQQPSSSSTQHQQSAAAISYKST